MHWIRVDPSGRLFWARQWKFVLCKMRGAPQLVERLLAPHDGLCSTELYRRARAHAHTHTHTHTHTYYIYISRLGCVVVSVLATETKGRRFRPGRGDMFLRAIKIRSKPSFGWEVKPEAPCRKILRHIKDPLTHFRCWYAKFSLLLPFLLLAPRCSCW
jgi:hypothetical protein